MGCIHSTQGLALPAPTVYCIGRNYSEHIAELGNVPDELPVVFIKPSAALHAGPSITLPVFSNQIHYEAELVLRVGLGQHGSVLSPATPCPENDAVLSWVSHLGLGLDLTARDIQEKAKQKGHPWAVAKGFRQSACVSPFLPIQYLGQKQENQEKSITYHIGELLAALEFALAVNGVQRQYGLVRHMLYPPSFLLLHLHQVFGLCEGDIIFTGTPSGVGPIQINDELSLSFVAGMPQAGQEALGEVRFTVGAS